MTLYDLIEALHPAYRRMFGAFDATESMRAGVNWTLWLHRVRRVSA